jgi:hypothetical protein
MVATSALACVEPTQRAVIAVPAAHSVGEGRPVALQPPFELMTNEGPNSDAVVRVVGEVTCSGALVAEDLVLTAHHCVAARDDEGRVMRHDVLPEQVSIELGGDHLPWGDVTVRAIVSPDCGYGSGEGDIALLVLSRKLIGVPTLVPRLEAPPHKGEEIEPVGFGRCQMTTDAIRRVTRAGGLVDIVRGEYFVAPASICPGDSGGPAFSRTHGDLVGVVSASVMDGDEKTSAPSLFTRLDMWRRLFGAARLIADGASSSELPPYRSCVW